MGLKFEQRKCAYQLCDEVFPVSNERKIFCCDRCRGRHYASVNAEETEMIRLENNKIIANYRILKELSVGRIFQLTELRLLGYELKYCSRYSISYIADDHVTRWCYNLGLTKLPEGYLLIEAKQN